MTPVLWVILFILLVVVTKQIISYKRSHDFPSESISAFYKKRKNVMNPSERMFYLILRNALSNKFIVLSKVRIEDFIDVRSLSEIWKDKQSLRGKIKSRHVDFLICDLLTTEPLCAIELDGYSHENFIRKMRDEFIDGLYKYVDLPVRHVKVGSDFANEVEEIKNILKQD